MKKILAIMMMTVMAVSMFAAEAVSAERSKLAGELLTIMRQEQQMKNAFQMMRNMQQKMLPQMLEQNGVKLTADQQAEQKKMMDEVMNIVEEEMSWNKLKPIVVEAYATTFSEQELKDLTTFFKSPVGQNFLDKTPMLQQQMMSSIQQMAMNMNKKVGELVQKRAAELQKKQVDQK